MQCSCPSHRPPSTHIHTHSLHTSLSAFSRFNMHKLVNPISVENSFLLSFVFPSFFFAFNVCFSFNLVEFSFGALRASSGVACFTPRSTRAQLQALIVRPSPSVCEFSCFNMRLAFYRCIQHANALPQRAPAPHSYTFTRPLPASGHASFKFHGKNFCKCILRSMLLLLLLLSTAFVTSFSLVFAHVIFIHFVSHIPSPPPLAICCAMWHVQLLPCPMSSCLSCCLFPSLPAGCNCPTSVHTHTHSASCSAPALNICATCLRRCLLSFNCVCVCVTVSNLNCLLWQHTHTHTRTLSHAIGSIFI